MSIFIKLTSFTSLFLLKFQASTHWKQK